MQARLNRIIVDPLSYIFSDRLRLDPQFISTSAARSAVNHLIIGYYELSCTIPTVEPTGSSYWIKNWQQLLPAAYLTGCLCRRADLMWCGNVFGVPDWAIHFVVTTPHPVQTAVPTTPRVVTSADLLCAGYACLRHLCTDLPVPLQQRLPLLFPAYVDSPLPEEPFPMFLMSVIIHYVKKNRIVLPASAL